MGVLPSDKTKYIEEEITPLFPGIVPYRDVLECGLSSMNPVVHPAGVLMNAGRIEYSRGNFISMKKGYRNP